MLDAPSQTTRRRLRLTLLPVLLAASATLALACSSSNNTSNNNKAATSAASASAAATVASGSPAATRAATSAGGSPAAAGSPSALPALPSGGTDDPKSLVMAFVPSRDVNQIQLSADKIAAYLTKALNRPVKSVTLTSYAAVAQALTAKTADLAWVGPLDYLIGHEQNGAYPITCSVRNGQRGYKAFIIVKSDSGINTVADLKGKSFAFGDPTSTSSSLVPRGAMTSAGINPDKDIKSVNISNQSAVATAVYNGQVDGGAIYDDARTNQEVISKYPDILTKTKIIYTSELIPCDPQIVRKDLKQDLVAQIRQALLTYAKDTEGKAVLKDLFTIDDLSPATDADYDGLRNLVKQVQPSLLKGYPSPTVVPASPTPAH
jgi:phosphonate transport system substrate-binding protein